MNRPIPRRLAARLLAAAFLVGAAGVASAQSYPSKPIKLVVPFPPGGVADLIARPLADKLSASLQQPVVVENRAGATGTIAGAYVANAAADGYTLLLGTTNEIAMSPSLYKSLPYDPTKAFSPIAPVAEFPNVLVVGSSVQADSLKALVALAQQRPGKLTFASSGPGSTNHLTAEIFKKLAGVDVVHVPYKGGGPALTDLVGGHVDAMFATLPSAVQYIRTGRLRALAVTGSRRSGSLPDVPTAQEAGLPGLDVTTWNGVLAPAGTPDDVRAVLFKHIQAGAAQADVRERYIEAGAEPMSADAEQFGKMIRDDFARWSAVIKDAAITAQ